MDAQIAAAREILRRILSEDIEDLSSGEHDVFSSLFHWLEDTHDNYDHYVKKWVGVISPENEAFAAIHTDARELIKYFPHFSLEALRGVFHVYWDISVAHEMFKRVKADQDLLSNT